MMLKLRRNTPARCLLTLAVVALPVVLHARDSIVLLDTKIYTQKKTGPYLPLAEYPADWTSPVDFSGGTLHFRMEVISKPSDKLIYWIPVFFPLRGKGSTFGNGKIAMTKAGVYEWKLKVSQHARGGVNGAPGLDVHNVPPWRMLLHWHDANDKHTKSGDSDYYPMTYRFTAVLVARGGKYVPPGIFGGFDSRKLVHLRALVPALQGEYLGVALLAAEKAVESKHEERAKEARILRDVLTNHAMDHRTKLTELKSEAPLYATTELEKLARQYLPSPLGRRLAKEAQAWNREPEVLEERRARRILAVVEKAADRLKSRLNRNRTLADLQRSPKYRQWLRTIGLGAVKLRNEYPTTQAAKRALRLAADFEIELPKSRTPGARSSARRSILPSPAHVRMRRNSAGVGFDPKRTGR